MVSDESNLSVKPPPHENRSTSLIKGCSRVKHARSVLDQAVDNESPSHIVAQSTAFIDYQSVGLPDSLDLVLKPEERDPSRATPISAMKCESTSSIVLPFQEPLLRGSQFCTVGLLRGLWD
ncbi:hypothetical protein EG68_09942 [Paragonimus skrjabini miyazakii]|uniref:Uncharacterized protein n=1 Tax=Paragonimus skrjabini miyazakii TaxID=59628 RepID=A0A8S9YKL6_9TREM|nr:hypothetical protein EG68_09942 [Paragonimus skrjabini miyazakii]